MSGYRKYGNRKVTTADGSKFDSQREHHRWCELQLLERAGRITDLRRQVKFVLVPAQYKEYERTGQRGQQLKPMRKLLEHECSYIADFVYHDVATDETVVEDAKGFRTDAYVIKRKLLLERFGLHIREV